MSLQPHRPPAGHIMRVGIGPEAVALIGGRTVSVVSLRGGPLACGDAVRVVRAATGGWSSRSPTTSRPSRSSFDCGTSRLSLNPSHLAARYARIARLRGK